MTMLDVAGRLFIEFIWVYGWDWMLLDAAGSVCGGRGGDRTHNPELRRLVLYPIELLAHT